MLKVEAVFRSTKLQQVKNELAEIGIVSFSMFKVELSGLSHGHTSGGRPGSFRTTALIPKTKIEIICKDKDIDTITAAIYRGAKTGQTGDGIIYACPIVHLIKIKNGKTGDQAI